MGGIPYVMPAIRMPGIQKTVVERASGARAAVSKYVLRLAPGGTEAGANLYILKKKGVRAKDARRSGGMWRPPPTSRARRLPICWRACRAGTGCGRA